MFFLLRTAFWLCAIILILPTDGGQRSEVLGAAEATVKDLSSFCTRNPETCAQAGEALAHFGDKAEFGVQLVMDIIVPGGEETATGVEPATLAPVAAEAPAPAEPPLPVKGKRRGTLTGDDLEPRWSLRTAASGV